MDPIMKLTALEGLMVTRVVITRIEIEKASFFKKPSVAV
jgi:hypothetical protein